MRALVRGDWPSILSSRAPILDGSRAAAELFGVVRIVASSMRSQARGDVDDAWKALAVAAGRLSPMMVHRVDGELLALVTPRPGGDIGIVPWTWWVSLVIWREQRELLDLRAYFGVSGRTRQEQLVRGCVEHRRWVEFDPWVGKRSTAKADGIPHTPTRAAICVRTNRLVRFVDPTARELDDVAGWKAAGALPGLGRLALEMVADGPAEPWTSENPATAHVPVRDGRRLLYEFSTQ